MSTPGKLFKAVSAVSLVALLVLSYVDMVHLPHQKIPDEQLAEAESPLDEVHEDVSRLRKRVDLLEAALLRLAPDLAAELGVAPRKVSSTAATTAPGTMLRAAVTVAAASRLPRWRTDDQCGERAPLHGKPAECNPDGINPCCAPSGWCGSSSDHCQCQGCVDYRSEGRVQRDQSPVPVPDVVYSEEKNKSIALVVPFRDRGVHLERFRTKIQAYVDSWTARGINHNWVVFVVEQFDTTLFNRGWLFNAGLYFARELAKKRGVAFDCVVMQDVDLLPEAGVDYGWCVWPIQLSGEIGCWSWGVPYPENVGGVTSMSPQHWSMINGFSNMYEGWGGEDDDLYYRLKQNSLLKGGCHTWCKQKVKPTAPMVYRPPLGRGRFRCLHDADHTPRQRATNDAQMWSRLNEMKANSKRWQSDGISNLVLYSAGPSLWSPACQRGSQCSAPEDPVVRKRSFSEMWVRVSSKPIAPSKRIEVKLLLKSTSCTFTGRPLASIPAGLESLRGELVNMFREACNGTVSWAHRTSFVLVDLMQSQALLVGDGAPVVVPDSSLPALLRRDQDAPAPQAAVSEYLVQGQRLSRWIRQLPPAHRGWIIAEEASSLDRQQNFIDKGHRVPLTVPICISYSPFDASRKYRATAGTKWCGDDGWKSQDYFLALRSKSSVSEDKLVPICISYESKQYTYRFEQSEDACVGEHRPSGTLWTHVYTIHTSADATGERVCVGVQNAKEKTRWIIQRKERCDIGSFVHSFAFSAMAVNAFEPVLAPCCLLQAELPSEGILVPTSGGTQVVQRLAGPEHCRNPGALGAPGLGPWKLVRDVLLLSRRQDLTDVPLCLAEGWLEVTKTTTSRDAARRRQWRVFQGSACGKAKATTHHSEGHKVQWDIQDLRLYAPANSSGQQLSLCHLAAAGSALSSGSVYAWAEGPTCPQGAVNEMSFRDISVADTLRYAHLIDDVV